MFRWPRNVTNVTSSRTQQRHSVAGSSDAYKLALAPSKAIHGSKLDVHPRLNELFLVADRRVRGMVAAPLESLFLIACFALPNPRMCSLKLQR